MNQMNITVMCPTHHAAAMGQQITMSSREIAKLVDSRHSNVCVTIERLMNSGVIGGMLHCSTPTLRTSRFTITTKLTSETAM
jgi:phage regulator Rha-like protein